MVEEVESKRFEFEGIVVDVITKDKEEGYFGVGGFGIVWMKPEEEHGHKIIAQEQFEDIYPLKIIENSLSSMEKSFAINHMLKEMD